MADGHITRELLHAWKRGEIDLLKLVRFGADHLVALCPYCHSELAAFLREQQGLSPGPDEARRLLAMIEAQARLAEKDQAAANRELTTLLALPSEERLPKIRRARALFRRPALALLLIEESRRHLHHDPRVAVHFAELAREVAVRSPDRGPITASAQALAYAHLANAHRAAGALQQASRFLDLAKHVLRYEGVLDLATNAEVGSLDGSLLMDMRLFELANHTLLQSVMFFRLVGRTAEAARTLIKVSYLHYLAGEVAQAIDTLEHALADLSPEGQPREYACAQLNLVLYLCETADYCRARHRLEAAQPFYRGFNDRWMCLRVVWLEGRIAAGLGELDAAEAAYLAARAGFAERQHGYDAAMVGLDLAALYLGQHRYPEIRQLAAEMLALFDAQGVHREALAAALLFERAAREETLSRGLLRTLVQHLEQAKKLPREAEDAAE